MSSQNTHHALAGHSIITINASYLHGVKEKKGRILICIQSENNIIVVVVVVVVVVNNNTNRQTNKRKM